MNKDGLNIVNHVSGRIKELRKLYNDISTKKTEMLIHQQLPNHMRRRAMSHNPKRIPYKYRKIHISQMQKSGLNKDTAVKKRPARKYRRKTCNLLKEYNRRKQNNVWLETHIWHAKRFRMCNLWGYKIPFTTNDKRYRASYKAVRSHCMLQDMSYYGGIEISGPIDILKKEFSRIIAKEVKPSITAQCYINGAREGTTDIFKIDSYPYGAIANVNFLWNSHDESSGKKSLWIFTHPAAYRDILNELISLFNATSSTDVNSNLMVRNPTYNNKDVSIVELKDTLNRFRLTGSLVNVVLAKALKAASNCEKSWLQDLFIENDFYKKSHLLQIELWEKFKSTNSTEFPVHCIIGLNIDDPRTNRFVTTKNEEIKCYERNIDMPEISPASALWRKDLRDGLIKTMISSGELCKLRNQKQLVPSIASNFEKNLQPIPIMLIQRPGKEATNLACGWDLIVPAGYGLSVWLNLIKFGAKAGGWKEHEMIMSETGQAVFSPDTVLGRKEADRISAMTREIYFRKPPNKRTNYRKISIASPFMCPFSQLIKEWNGSSESFYVQRDPTTLSDIISSFKDYANLSLDLNALIPVKIHMISRGSPDNNSIVCLPNKKDVKFWIMTQNRQSKCPIFSEKVVTDTCENDRRISKFNHKKELKRLRNERVREKRRSQNAADKFVKIAKPNTEQIVKQQFQKISNLWLPDESSSIRHQCSREVFGYLTDSRFSLNMGKVSGVGFITSGGLIELFKLFQKFKNLKPFVLIRSPNSTSYHVATIAINR